MAPGLLAPFFRGGCRTLPGWGTRRMDLVWGDRSEVWVCGEENGRSRWVGVGPEKGPEAWPWSCGAGPSLAGWGGRDEHPGGQGSQSQ